jgi:dihydrofolate reductase
MAPGRQLVVTQNMTLDGVIDASEGWFDVVPREETDDIQEELRRQMAVQDALLLGRKTFEELRGYWPKQENDTTGVTDHLNRVSKYVVSSTISDPRWENTTVVDGDVEGEVRRLKDQPGKEIGLTGSIQLTYTLVAADLVDEYRLFVYPVVVGTGRKLFEGGATGTRPLELVDAKPFDSGVVLLTYHPR